MTTTWTMKCMVRQKAWLTTDQGMEIHKRQMVRCIEEIHFRNVDVFLMRHLRKQEYCPIHWLCEP